MVMKYNKNSNITFFFRFARDQREINPMTKSH